MINYLAHCKLTDKLLDKLSQELKLDLSNIDRFNIDDIHCNIYKKVFIVNGNPPFYTLPYNNIYNRWHRSNNQDYNILIDELNSYLFQFYKNDYKNEIDKLISIDEQNIEFNQISQLTKPNENNFDSTGNDKEGNELGTCGVCGLENVIIDTHVCSKVISSEITPLDENYTANDIKTVLWNTYKEKCGKIDIINDQGPNFIFKVYPDEDSTLEEISALSEELFNTDLFDIQFKRDLENKEYLLVEFLNEEILERYQFKFILENTSKKEFDEDQIKNLLKRFDSVNIKYHNNQFFKSIINTLKTKKSLTQKQFNELDYLLKHGKTMYENGYLTTKN